MSKETKGTNSATNRYEDISAYNVNIVNGKVELRADFQIHALGCVCKEICGPVGYIKDLSNAYTTWAKANAGLVENEKEGLKAKSSKYFSPCDYDAFPRKSKKRKNRKGEHKKYDGHSEYCSASGTNGERPTACQSARQYDAAVKSYLMRTLPGEYALYEMMRNPEMRKAFENGNISLIKAEHHNKVMANFDALIHHEENYSGTYSFKSSKQKGSKLTWKYTPTMAYGPNAKKLKKLKQQLAEKSA